MTLIAKTVLMIAALAVAPAADDRADSVAYGEQLQIVQIANTTGSPVYKPPLRGRPAGTVGGGTRGPATNLPNVRAVAPLHVGLTEREQPVLYWFLSQEANIPVEVTLSQRKGEQPLLQLTVAPPVRPGFHAVRLGEHGVRLVPSVTYEWYVALVPNPEHRSNDLVAGGAIERVDLEPAVKQQLPTADARRRVALYAEHGVWYDAFDVLSNEIATAPDNATLKEDRAALLRQVGLGGLIGADEAMVRR